MRPINRALAAASATVLCAAGLAAAIPGSSAAAAGFGFGTPAFVDSSPPATVDAGLFANADFAGEPSIGTDWTTGAMLYQADNSTYKIAAGGQPDAPTFTWSDVSSPASQVNLDPILATNSQTGSTLAGGDDGACAVMSLTHDDGATWVPTLPCPIAADHPTVGLGPFVSPAPVDAVGTEAGFFCQQPILNAAPDECSYSHNGGVTWQPSVPDSSGVCTSLFGHVKIGSDGVAYIPNANCSGQVGGLITTDSGQTLSHYVIPGSATPKDGFDPSVAVDSNKRIYESWSATQPNGDYHPVITWSDDQGKTWAPIVDLAGTTSPGITAATFEAAVAGDSGRAAVAYLGTTTPTNGADPFATGFVGVWNLYISFTYDGGATWQTVQATTNPVQIGEIDAGGTNTTGQRNLLDFMDASLTKDGRVVVAYADGCINACNANSTPAASMDSYATIAYQTTGEGMFSAFDTAAPVTSPTAPALASTTPTNGTVGLSWNAPNDGGAPITSYQVYRGASAGTETAYATVTAGTSYVDSAVTPGSTYFYRVAATNSAGTGSPSNEVSATPTTTPGAPTLTGATGKSGVTLSWSAPSNGGTAITGYSIYRGTSPGAETLIQTISNGMSYVDNTVSGGTTYYYTVAASNADGTGTQSNEIKEAVKGKK